ncbi:MAG: tRNA pseudouridine(38-40) synthase TruA [Fusobacteriaceae bacterium]|nr:tRNA pseudouridine(38-40) synthase TruA [Fusobacteriaceae bacterium]MBP9562291.1 tRNA pseudouridine(38-40) synthase TruA [Acetoanaerobium sp.]MBU9918248.1 tRNA pseudouridine(38-40) synthase TruA [Fusobacteriaceae bacterium]
MRNVKIEYQYDGSKYYGFQRQKNKVTVQGDIEKVILNKFKEKVNMVSSGRTDRGVHALGQVSNFLISKKIPLEAIKSQINKILRGKVKILNIEEVHSDFNARFAAKRRTYLYVLKNKNKITPFEDSYVTSIHEEIDIDKLQLILQPFIGVHDFSSFAKKDEAMRNPIREIYSIDCYYNKCDERYYIEISGSSFLKTMIRIIVGSALQIYFGKKEANYITSKLENADENTEKILAPSEGLYLYKIEY